MMDRSRFESAQTFTQFVESATNLAELWHIGAKRAEIEARIVCDLEKVSRRINIAILNEDWCLDAVGSVPYIAKLADLIAPLEVRLLGREANPDLMDSHLTNGGRSIPLAIVYDEDWREIGTWGPRPAPLQEWVRSTGLGLAPAEKYHHVRQWYARDHGKTSIRELVKVVWPEIFASAAA